MFVLFLDYSTHAEIHVERGFRRLVCNGYRYAEYYKYLKTEDVLWKCTKGVYDRKSGKRKPCIARIRTKITNGYEMIENPNANHNHRPLKYIWSLIFLDMYSLNSDTFRYIRNCRKPYQFSSSGKRICDLEYFRKFHTKLNVFIISAKENLLPSKGIQFFATRKCYLKDLNQWKCPCHKL